MVSDEDLNDLFSCNHNKSHGNLGSVNGDPDYLAALTTTRSEIIVPIVSAGAVIGVLNIESETSHAFDPETQLRLEQCASMIASLWESDKTWIVTTPFPNVNAGAMMNDCSGTVEQWLESTRPNTPPSR